MTSIYLRIKLESALQNKKILTLRIAWSKLAPVQKPFDLIIKSLDFRTKGLCKLHPRSAITSSNNRYICMTMIWFLCEIWSLNCCERISILNVLRNIFVVDCIKYLDRMQWICAWKILLFHLLCCSWRVALSIVPGVTTAEPQRLLYLFAYRFKSQWIWLLDLSLFSE